ncbi:ABC transporter permease [Pelosinus fermentans]|uniref:ABC-type transporter, integral membrane subunit n=1 Tax=Pelosinus fermentans JBW45 TaxID=1192197 RepID=I9NT81_9FIRM|nr:ABC transporter permease [Pelosinus fermentans]AJQ26270.1 ABC-type transporter, integral membrane subunit [Pelosinus fermentans JBW45]
MNDLLKKREFVMFMMLMVISICISLITPTFLTPSNLLSIVMNNIILAIMAMGMTLVIVTSGIDVSVGSQLGFAAIFVGLVALIPGSNILTVLAVGIVSGIVLGLLNGILIAGAEIPAIVVTLGTMNIFRGSLLLYTNGKWVTALPAWYTSLYNTSVMGIPIPIIILLLVIGVTYFITQHTRLGRSIYALGGNPAIASRVGINTGMVTMFVFAYMGALTGIASILYGAQLATIDPNAGTSFELMVISAVVIGGANVLGGSGSLLGSLIGVLILGVLQNGIILMRIEPYWQNVVVGLTLITAVTLDVVNNRKKEERKKVIYVAEEVKAGGSV